MMEISHVYDDIISLPRPVSRTHVPMSLTDRAAQFAPFAALTGFEAAIAETARLTETKLELSEEQKLEIGETLVFLNGRIRNRPKISVTFFQPDERKTGGSTVTVKGSVRKIDLAGEVLKSAEGTEIPFDYLYAIVPENESADETAEGENKR